jgi:hypothetical protein
VVGDHVVGGEEAGFLVGKVLVEGAAGDRGRFGDVGDGGGVVAALGDGVDQGGDDPLALVLLDELARQAVPAGGQARRGTRGCRIGRLALLRRPLGHGTDDTR